MATAYPEHKVARFAGGTMRRIGTVLAKGESTSAFLRAAVEREIKQRERAALEPRGKQT